MRKFAIKSPRPSKGRGYRWRISAWAAAGLVLLLPLMIMTSVTDQVNWDAADFAIFGCMLATAGVTLTFAARMTGNKAYRAAVGLALASAFILVWMNLAVGIIGSEDDPANRMYAGVLVVGFVGAVAARFRPGGMAWAMVMTAIAQVLVPVIGQVGGYSIWILTGMFVALWLVSAWLFRKSCFPTSASKS